MRMREMHLVLNFPRKTIPIQRNLYVISNNGIRKTFPSAAGPRRQSTNIT